MSTQGSGGWGTQQVLQPGQSFITSARLTVPTAPAAPAPPPSRTGPSTADFAALRSKQRRTATGGTAVHSTPYYAVPPSSALAPRPTHTPLPSSLHPSANSHPVPGASSTASAADSNPALTPGMRDFLTQVRTSALFPPSAVRYTERNVAAARNTSHMNTVHKVLYARFTTLHTKGRLAGFNFDAEPLAFDSRPRAPRDTAPPPPVRRVADIRDTARSQRPAQAPLAPRGRDRTLPAWAAGGGSGGDRGSKRPRSPTPAPAVSGYIPLVTASPAPKPSKTTKRATKAAARKAAKAEKAAARAAAKAAAKAGKRGVGGKGGVHLGGAVGVDHAARSARALRFHAAARPAREAGGGSGYGAVVFSSSLQGVDGADFDLDSIEPIVGTSSALEKSYFRLNAPPMPSEVRPRAVLAAAVQHVLRQHANGSKPYLWASDQLKAVRQDCVIQQLQGAFAVGVYEAHARLALQNADVSEFNQCLTQLIHLYGGGVPGATQEFAAYQVLYYVFSESEHDAVRVLQELSKEQMAHPAVQHAFEVRAATSTGNYAAFARLRASAPNLNGFLMDRFAHRVRNAALGTMAKAFRPSLPLSYVRSALGMGSDGDTVRLIEHCGGAISGWTGPRAWETAKEEGTPAVEEPELEDARWGAAATFDCKASANKIKVVKAPEELVANRMV